MRLTWAEDIEILPINTVNPLVNLTLHNIAKVHKGLRPGELDRDMSQHS